jgi:methylglutaconyl-CoA hydratase
MKAWERVEIEIDGAVARVWINRPDVRNAFDAATVADLWRAVQTLRSRGDVRVIVLGGRGPAFCAGADLAWMRDMAHYSRDENERDAEALAELFHAVHDSPKPVVARVHGAALGGGAGLVAACDVGVAAEDTIFGFTEVRLGIVPSVISPYVLAKVGPGHAGELFLTGERFNAAHAWRIGLVQRVVPEAELDPAVNERVGELLKAGPEAIARAKALVRDVAFRSPADVRRLTIERIAEARASAEGQEGMHAFLEKRKPRWIV